MELANPPDPRRLQLMPVVTYAAEREIAKGEADYWDYATLLELAILSRNEEAALDALANAVARIREPWEPETTARNLSLIHEAREQCGDQPKWATDIEQELNRRS